jgi:hypothetical protein
MLYFSNYGWLCPGLNVYFVVNAAARPNTTKSNKELAPNLLAPCTDATAAYPHDNNPGTTVSLPSTNLTT